MIEYDFETPNSELAEIVLNVANDCYYETTGHGRVYRLGVDIKISADALFPFFREAIKKSDPEIDDESIHAILQEIDAKQNEEKEREEQLKAEIRKIINNQAETGWKLAYKLCRNLSDDTAKKVRYHLIDHFDELSVQEIIEICNQYSEVIEGGSSKYKNAEIYLNIAEKLIKSLCSDRNTEVLSEIEKYLEKYYGNDESMPALENIIAFCRKNNLASELDKWEKKYVDLCLRIKDPSDYSGKMIIILLSCNQIELIQKIIRDIDPTEFSNEVVDKLIKLKEYDTVEFILERMAENEEKKIENQGSVSSVLSWIESIQYRLQYYRAGYSFYTNWTSILFYDDLKSDNQELNERINCLKSKYRSAFYTYRCCLTDFELYNWNLSGEKRKEFYSRYIDACKREIEVIPQILDYINSVRRLLSNKDYKAATVYNTGRIVSRNKLDLINCKVFKDLAIYYKKNKFFEEAIKVCDAAISIGYIDDGTKMGMKGRREKLLVQKMKFSASEK